jgi:hypothetical protein
MSKTNLPGFTADLSLYRSNAIYRTGATSVSGSNNSVQPAMIDDNTVHCGNCVGGECAELHCFENWTHGGGGGSSGPYGDGGGGFGFGGGVVPPVRRGCRDDNGRLVRHGTTVQGTVEIPPGGAENTYIIHERCNNGRWQVIE